MIKSHSLRKKSIAIATGVALLSSVAFIGFSTPAVAQSFSLTQLVNLFISLGIIAPDKAAAAEAAVAGAATTAPAFQFTRNLTVGSTGSDVSTLQGILGVTQTGYFGNLTKAAVEKFQTTNNLAATGYVGKATLAALNAINAPATPVTVSTTTTTAVVPVSTPVTNTGVEGILTVNLNPTPSSGQNVYEGDSKDSLIGIELQAQLSPITIQRVQLDLGNSTAFYTKVFPTLYLVDPNGNILAQAALNGNTVTKQTNGSTNTYYLNFSGFNYTVPGDNSIHVLTVKGDVYGSIDTGNDAGGLSQYFTGDSVSISIDADGVRGVDGAGVDQYGPVSGSISNSVLVNNSLADSAQLEISTDSATPLASNIVASSGGNDNEADGVTVLTLDAYAQKDNITIDDLTGNTSFVSGNAAPTTAYLYAGSQQIGSAAISSTGAFTFSNMSYTIPVNTTQVLTIKEDIKNADATAVGLTTTVLASGVNAENSQGNTITGTLLSGSATGNQLTVIKEGPEFTLVGTPTISYSTGSEQDNTSTSSAYAVFTIGITAQGGNLYFAGPASNPFVVGIYEGGVETVLNDASSTSFSTPSSGVVTSGLPSGFAFEIQQNNTVQIPVTVIFSGRNTDGSQIPTDIYAAGIDSINYSVDGVNTISTNFMKGQTNWRTSSITLP